MLKPYKVAVDRWLSPDVFKDQSPSLAKAKKAIADYTKANGRPEGIAELRVYYCERAIEFCRDVGVYDEVYLVALVQMFASALKMPVSLAEPQRALILARLDKGRGLSHECGYGVGFELEDLFDSYVGGG